MLFCVPYNSTMSGVIIDCPEHGLFEAENAFSHSGGARVHVVGARASCPLCGRVVPIVDGRYTQEVFGGLSAVLNPTPDQLVRLRRAALWAQREAIRPEVDQADVREQLRKTVAVEAPGILRLIDVATSRRAVGVAAWIAILIALVQFVSSSQAEPLTPEVVEEIIEQVEREIGREVPAPSPRQPKEPLVPRELGGPEQIPTESAQRKAETPEPTV